MNTLYRRWFFCLVWLILATTVSAFHDPHIGRWINRDPIGENGGENVYGFLNNAPIDDTDDLGLRSNSKRQPYNLGFTVVSKTTGDCGEFAWTNDFVVSPRAETGYVIQRVHRKITITNEDGSKNHQSESKKWREAFTVPTFMTDTISGLSYDKTKGKMTVFLDATYHSNLTLDDDWNTSKLVPDPTNPGGVVWSPPNPTGSGSAPWNTNTYTPWNPTNRGDSNHLIRRVIATWDCRCTSSDRKTKLEVSP